MTHRLVRCRLCSTTYDLVREDAGVAPLSWCPRCGYVGWAPATAFAAVRKPSATPLRDLVAFGHVRYLVPDMAGTDVPRRSGV